tara:strand:+ start:8863 stop:9837 length:975 start_codon:yes stop_codon:yes gene_type:complete
MANTVQIKRHNSNTTTTPPGSLANGELALNQAAKKLFVGRHNNSSVEVFHLPTLQDLTYGNGISGTVASGSNDNSSTIAVDVTDSNIFATSSAKGIASFSSDDFSVSSGAVTIKAQGIASSQIAGDAITSAKIADEAINSEHFTDGSIDTEHIADAQITLAKMASNSVNSSKIVDGSIATADIANDAITAAKIVDNIALAGNCSTTGNFEVGGNLTVSGTTTTVNSTTVTVDDPIFTLGGDSTPGSDDNKDRGIEFKYHTGSAAKVGFFGFDDSTGKFTFIADASNSSEVFSGSAGPVAFGAITGTTCTLTGALDGATIDGGTY